MRYASCSTIVAIPRDRKSVVTLDATQPVELVALGASPTAHLGLPLLFGAVDQRSPAGGRLSAPGDDAARTPRR